MYIKINYIIYAYESTVSKSKSLIYERIRMRIEDQDE